MQYVYVLQSEVDPQRFYTGATTDPERRLKEHNSGKSIHTNKHKPWRLSVCIGFADRAKALRFEQYLKSGSGRAFAKKTLLKRQRTVRSILPAPLFAFAAPQLRRNAWIDGQIRFRFGADKSAPRATNIQP